MGTFDYVAAITKLQDAWVEFNSLIPTYRKQLEIMRRLKAEYSICNKLALDKIPELFLREEKPRNRFLDQPNLEAAINYLYDCTPRELEQLLHDIETERQGAFYTRLTDWLKSAKPRIMALGKPAVYQYSMGDELKRRERLRKLAELLD